MFDSQAFDDWMDEMIYRDSGDYYPEMEDTPRSADHEQLVEWTATIQHLGGVVGFIQAHADHWFEYDWDEYGSSPYHNMLAKVQAMSCHYPDMMAAALVELHDPGLEARTWEWLLTPDSFVEILQSYLRLVAEMPAHQMIEEWHETDV